MRQAFVMRLREGALPEYRRRHAAAWPELLEAIGTGGVRRFSIHHEPGTERLFLYSEVDDPAAWPRAWATPVHERWGREMEPLMAVEADGSPAAAPLDELFGFARDRR